MYIANVGMNMYTRTEQVCEGKNRDKQKTDSKLNPYECATLHNFKLYNIHAEGA